MERPDKPSIFAHLKAERREDAPAAPAYPRQDPSAPASVEVPALRAELYALRPEISELRSELGALGSGLAELRAGLADLRAGLDGLRGELEPVKTRLSAPPPPPPPPALPREAAARLEHCETALSDLGERLAGAERKAADAAPAKAFQEDLKTVELRVTDLGTAFAGLKRAISGESELAARLTQYEAALSDVKRGMQALQEAEKRELGSMASRDAVEAMSVKLSGAMSALEEMKKGFASRSEEFSSIGAECRKALGEMRGYVKNAEQKPLSERFDEYLRDAVSQLSARVTAMETDMHAGHAELAGRLSANEVLYEKIFLEAEQRVKQGVAAEIKGLQDDSRWLRENVVKMTDLYTVVMERKMRLLEGKYAAFEAISRRMDDIDEALKRREGGARL